MRLSILDQAPISAGQTAHDALNESMKLAQIGERLGYARYWIVEHHDLEGLACPAPEVMLGFIGAQTTKIRIGSGAILLPHYKPFKVAETFNLLATLFPERIDLGIGRAPGGSAEATTALNDEFLKKVYEMPRAIEELLHFLKGDFPSDHMFSKVKAAPMPEMPPTPWILGTSKKSALQAAEHGLPYVFGQFMSSNDGFEIVQMYRENFRPSRFAEKPEVILTVSAYCAETNKEAEKLALGTLISSLQRGKGEAYRGVPSFDQIKDYPLTNQEREGLVKMQEKIIMGNPGEVKLKLERLLSEYEADEIMMVTITHNPADRAKSYELIAEECLQ